MNIYFLVEGRRTEKKVYPKWMSILVPELSEVKFAFEATLNNYYVFTGSGYPSLLNNHLRNTIIEVNELEKYEYLVLCIDADDISIEERTKEVLDFMQSNSLSLNKASLVLIIQNRCIETWFLGNRKVYSKQPQSQLLREYNKFYNVQIKDPELMQMMKEHDTIGDFHHSYLKEMLQEKNIRYTKKNPNGVVEEHYLNELISRQEDTNHLLSFKSFLDFCKMVKEKVN